MTIDILSSKVVAVATDLDFYAKHGAALFPIPVGKKAPGKIVESFKKNASRDPAQWAKWRTEHPGCNFGVVAFASNWITLDTDIKPVEGQTKEDARAEAWAMRGELFKSWGMNPDTLPHVESAHGGWHDHFALPPGVDATTLRQPDAIKKRINVRVKGYTVAAGGYYDGSEKNDAPGHYQLFANAAAPHPTPIALIEHCSPAKVRENVAKIGSHDRGDVGGLICWLDERDGFSAYEDWCALGMALKLECGDDAKDLWALSHNSTVTEDVIESKWDSFASEATANSVTLNSFMKRAHDAGWKGSIRPSVGSMFGGMAQLAAAAGAPGVPTVESPPIAPNAPPHDC
jgi:Bifunctional DNA primase/polymerase, N-terminal/Primase C terminal 2 (PriCT-2)